MKKRSWFRNFYSMNWRKHKNEVNLNCFCTKGLNLSCLLFSCSPEILIYNKSCQIYCLNKNYLLITFRYAIGNAERPHLISKVGWLDILANDTHQFYHHNNTGGPSIKVYPAVLNDLYCILLLFF